MARFNEIEYSSFFCRLTSKIPYQYQTVTAKGLYEGKNLILRIPTGAGKTWAVLAPFFYYRHSGGPTRLIYALPLRTLAQGIYEVAQKVAEKEELPIMPQYDKQGREVVSPAVTLQTGEQPDDPFFTRGIVIITTYHQVLSGLLGGPYGLSHKVRNINAATMMGTLVVFDEFHLMPPQRAFLTAVAGHSLFRRLTQSVWMTATATNPLRKVLSNALNCEPISLNPEELQNLPSVSQIERKLRMEPRAISAVDVLQYPAGRSIVLVNTVGRAQRIFQDLKKLLEERHQDTPVMLLHSRFFKNDRSDKEKELRNWFGPECTSPAVLVATQVVEAGLDISCDHLHTEVCPMNALVQRAGRCARFPGETGTVHVYQLPEEERSWLPYGDSKSGDAVLGKTQELLSGITETTMTPDIVADWIEQIHSDDDNVSLRQTWSIHQIECLRRIKQNITANNSVSIADLIRGEDTDRVRVILAWDGCLPDNPSKMEGVNLSRWAVSRLIISGQPSPGWFWDLAADNPVWKPIHTRDELKMAYIVCLRPGISAYSKELGLRVGERGDQVSPQRIPPPRPGYASLHAESWQDHALNVSRECRRRFEMEFPKESRFIDGLKACFGLNRDQMVLLLETTGFLHDLGKLNQEWQGWAEEMQRSMDAGKLGLLPLAHTDLIRNDNDKVYQSGIKVRRPAHAAQSAYLVRVWYGKLLSHLPESVRGMATSACSAAIIAHHGGWLTDGIELSSLVKGWSQSVDKILGFPIEENTILSALKRTEGDKSRDVGELLEVSMHSDKFTQWWPLVAYLTRTLRLSDQRATAEGGSE